jgi:hypothetical protein
MAKHITITGKLNPSKGTASLTVQNHGQGVKTHNFAGLSDSQMRQMAAALYSHGENAMQTTKFGGAERSLTIDLPDLDDGEAAGLPGSLMTAVSPFSSNIVP